MIKTGRTKKRAAQMVAYPGYGFVDQERWRLCISGVAFKTPEEFNRRKRLVIRMLRGAMEVSSEQTDSEMFRSRVAPFMADAGWRIPVTVQIGSRTIRLKKKTRRNGHFTANIRLASRDVEAAIETSPDGKRLLRFVASTDHPKSAPVEGVIHLLDRRGISVISDIDDTIKVSAVDNRRELLANTFLREFRGVEGMSRAYQSLSKSGLDFHYVSSSPWQLFDPLHGMQKSEGFPDGTLHLRNYKISDQITKRVPIFRRQGKFTAIRRLMKDLPERRFILIGDSGEKDPEIYRKACRRRPEQIAGVFIRELEARPISDERIQRLNRDPDLVRCQKFSSAGELQDLVGEVLAGSP